MTTSQPVAQSPQPGLPAAGDIDVLAISDSAGLASATSEGGAVLGDGGAGNATTIVQPTVLSYIGDGATITAAGNVGVTSNFNDTSVATALGASGAGGVAAAVPKGILTDTPIVQAYVGSAPGSNGTPTDPAGNSTQVTAGSDVTIGTNCTAVDQVAVVSGGGAFLDNTDVAVGKLTLTNTSLATVGDDVGIKAGGAFSLLANSSSSPTIQVYAIGGTGFVGVAEAEAAEPVTFATDARVGSAATIQAAGELAVDTDAQVNALDEAQSFSDAAVGVTVAYSNHDNNSDYTPNGISVNGDSTVEIGQGAALHADTVDLSALISYLHAADHAGAETFCDALLGVAVSYAEANITVNTTAQALIDGAASAPDVRHRCRRCGHSRSHGECEPRA